ncbi:unnamed protein product [Schistocephalus solidus]|uniref:G_PROTEIN_RECEP_F1_2 domain-containing protein n=1 Tax=Schistocephalus solidus TaxID=70667 RepID=A0A183SHM6_SCHSO|nr:unnamed protein product [Schistocephalus solidus]
MTVYLTSVAVTVFILPAFFIALCHVLMVARIWQAASRNRDLSKREKQTFACGHTTVAVFPNINRGQGIIHEEDAVEGQSKRKVIKFTRNTGCIPRARVKTVKMTLVIVSVYIICWCPYMIWNLLVTFGAVDKSLPNFSKISPLIQVKHSHCLLIKKLQTFSDFKFIRQSSDILDIQCTHNRFGKKTKSTKVGYCISEPLYFTQKREIAPLKSVNIISM